jgi:hypothetical protein
MKNKSLKINLYEFLLGGIVSISFTSLVLLVFHSYNGIWAVSSGALIYVLFLKLFKIKVSKKIIDINHPWVLALILLVSLVFRLPPFPYIIGGQDQGTYVNMSAHYNREGSNFVKDKVIPYLETEKEIKYYEEFSQFNDGAHLPGIYRLKDPKKITDYVFQFYPLHPLWMANFSSIFGEQARFYSLTFFSLISIISMYLLTKEISGQELPAVIAGFLIAVNPLHTFFSKFPVTEIVGLAFTTSAFLFLIKFHKSVIKNKNFSFIFCFLSLGLFGCFFFTHISSFLYMPFFLLLFYFILVWKSATRYKFIFYFLALFLIFGLSVVYGFNYTNPYAVDIYTNNFSSFFGSHWKKMILLFVGSQFLTFFIFIYTDVSKLIRNKLEFIKKIVEIYNPLFLLTAFLLGFYKAYKLGFTNAYINNGWINKRWNMAQKGIESLRYANLFVYIEYLSPFIFLLLIFQSLSLIFKKSSKYAWLILFVAYFIFLKTYVKFTTPYQYYYARYLLLEIVPFSIILGSVFLDRLWQGQNLFKIISGLCLIGAVVWFGYFSIYQIGKVEKKDAYLDLKAVSQSVKTSDFIFTMQNDWQPSYIEPGIRMAFENYFNLKTLSLIKVTDLPIYFVKLINEENKDFYILTRNKIKSSYLNLLKAFNFNYTHFCQRNVIPRCFVHQTQDVYLYKIEKERFKKAQEDVYYIDQAGYTTKVTGFINKTWTNGKGFIEDINYRLEPENDILILQTGGHTPFIKNLEKYKIKLLVNDRELKMINKVGNDLQYQLPDDLEIIDIIEINSPTFIPKELGINDDTRVLGLDIDNVLIK